MGFMATTVTQIVDTAMDIVTEMMGRVVHVHLDTMVINVRRRVPLGV